MQQPYPALPSWGRPRWTIRDLDQSAGVSRRAADFLWAPDRGRIVVLFCDRGRRGGRGCGANAGAAGGSQRCPAKDAVGYSQRCCAALPFVPCCNHSVERHGRI